MTKDKNKELEDPEEIEVKLQFKYEKFTWLVSIGYGTKNQRLWTSKRRRLHAN